MPRDRLTMRMRMGVRVGLIAAAATTGALVAFGARRGAPLSAFPELVGATAGGGVGAALLGLGLHAAGVVALGVLFVVVAAGLRGVRLLAAAAIAACLAFVLNSAILPGASRDGAAPVLDSAHLAALYLLLAVALAMGMRLALKGTDLG